MCMCGELTLTFSDVCCLSKVQQHPLDWFCALRRAAQDWHIPVVPLDWLTNTISTGKLIPLAAHKVASWQQGDVSTMSRSVTATGAAERDGCAQVRTYLDAVHSAAGISCLNVRQKFDVHLLSQSL